MATKKTPTRRPKPARKTKVTKPKGVRTKPAKAKPAKAKPAKAKPAKAKPAKAKRVPAKAKRVPAKAKSAARAASAARPRAATRPAKAKRAPATRVARRRPAAVAPSSAPVVERAPDEDTLRLVVKPPLETVTTIIQSVELPAPPDEIYRTYMNEARHAAFTGAPASIQPWIGGSFSAWDSYITGLFLELEEGSRIVQTWRTTEWPDGHDDSRVELTLEPVAGGKTKLTLVHTAVPSVQIVRYKEGWQRYYWQPLLAYLRVEGTQD